MNKDWERIIRKFYKEELANAKYWEKKREESKNKKYTKDYYWAIGREWVINELATELGVELYDDDLKLIEE